jgi:hypothetical protein
MRHLDVPIPTPDGHSNVTGSAIGITLYQAYLARS